MPSIDERSRHELYLAFEDLIGADKADTLMSMLPPVGWADVATKRDLTHLEGRFDRLEDRFDRLEEHFDRLEGRFEAALRDQGRSFVTWMLTAQASTVTLVVAALALFR